MLGDLAEPASMNPDLPTRTVTCLPFTSAGVLPGETSRYRPIRAISTPHL